MPRAPPVVVVLAAAGFLPSPASRCAAVAPRSAAPPSAHAVPRPGSRESPTPGAIRNAAAAPTAPATGEGGRRGRKRGSARPAASGGHRTADPSASHAATLGAHSTADAMPRDAPPAAACAARSPRSEACRAAGAASRWRRSASLPSARVPPAGNATPRGARKANVWIAQRPPEARHAVRAAHIVPTPARQSVTWRRSGRRRSP